jgi:hypothetical protein
VPPAKGAPAVGHLTGVEPETQLPVLADTSASPPAPNADPKAQDDWWQSFSQLWRQRENPAGDPNARNPRSSASGVWQLTDGSYQDTIARHPELKGQDKNSEAVAKAYIGDNRAAMQKILGRDPSNAELQLSVAIGASAASHAVMAGADTPVDQVLSPEAVAANPQWRGMTVAQLMQSVNNPPKGGGGRGPVIAATTSQPVTGGDSGIPGAASLFQQQMDLLKQYIASQPAMWDKLSKMQQDYLNATKLTPAQQLHDTFQQWAMAQNAANANLNATPGGVYWHALPNPEPFQRALAAGQDIEQAQRQHQWDVAGNAYRMGADALKGQMQQAYQNVGLSNTLAGQMVDYQTKQQQLGIESRKIDVELAQLGQQQTDLVGKFIETNVGDPETRAWVLSHAAPLLAQNPNASLQDKYNIITGVINDAQKQGMRVAARQPAQYMVGTWTENGVQKSQTFNMTEAADQQAAAALSKQYGAGFKLTNPSATQITNTVNPDGGGKPQGEGAGAQQTPDQVVFNMSHVKQTTQAARAVLDEIIRRGGTTGNLTDTDSGKATANVLRQLGFDTTAPLHELWGKLMQEIDTAQVLPQLKAFGARVGQQEFNTLLKQVVGPNYSPQAARTFLDHVDKMADFVSEATLDKEAEEKKVTDAGQKWLPGAWASGFLQRRGGAPSWDLSPLLSPQSTTTTQPGQPQVGETRTTSDGKTFTWDGKNWVIKQ